MAIRDKLTQNVQPLLEPGETLQAVFPAQTGFNPWLIGLTGFIIGMIFTTYVVVAITDKRIAVFKAGPLAPAKPKELLATFPRDTKLGPVSGIWSKFQLGDRSYWVHKRFHKDIAAAGTEASAAPATT
jgi:hypothetical protein